ncbi:hypothetical protein ERJ75_000821900 [Trypanosoma vivax]|uniref:Uncharacterized protein n=1 Tax=Trypanosoma vivax (strain Y486) TaxID=1055687 RepID=G0UBJ0_TRYVY|nr:hypothetical protein TRVL_03686 [Trypanosoma vivax]KAH8612997.1 hypothetical protein ERJ75_000821900 [Trypanosoma vivax]CCC53186.1 conserved hypothetical protein [Trypanosoma vivax Y486]
MRSGFRRGRLDKIQHPGPISSYSAALYPPRVYHYYSVQSNSTAFATASAVGPSIDDGGSDLRGRESFTDGGGFANDKRATPPLREFLGCFVDSTRFTVEARSFEMVEGCKELLNVLHYPGLLGVDTKVKSDATDVSGCQYHAGRVSQHLHLWEEILNLPSELRFYSCCVARGGELKGIIERLRIRPVRKKRLIKPLRRGATVIIHSVATNERSSVTRSVRRSPDDEQRAGFKALPRQCDGDDTRDDDGDGGYDNDDDEESLSFQVDDDDDGGELDGPEGSGDENDFF